MKFFNKINGDFIKRGIILLSVIIGINIVYIGGNKYNKKIDNENTDKNYYDNYFSNDDKRIWPVKIKNIIITNGIKYSSWTSNFAKNKCIWLFSKLIKKKWLPPSVINGRIKAKQVIKI